MNTQPLIHFAHANGVPSKVYQKLFDNLQDDYTVVDVPLLGMSESYAIDNHWQALTDQVIESIESSAQGRPVIGLGHSLGSVLTFLAAYKRPDLFQQVIMLDPPLIMGKASFLFHLTKLLYPKMIDKITPAGLSDRRRDHWDSRQQAYDLLRHKGLYQQFDETCFQAYIDHALIDDPIRGGVTLTIPKAAEVEIFRTTPSKWWLPLAKPAVPVVLVVGDQSPFMEKKFPHMVQKKWNIPFIVTQGGHMFPLEHPQAVAQLIKAQII